MPTIRDGRASKTRPWGYVVCTDTFLSGMAGYDRSIYALAVTNPTEAEVVASNARKRSDMKRPRLVRSFRADGTPKVRLNERDHLAVVDRPEAERWYDPNGW